MLTLFAIAVIYAAARGAFAALNSWRDLPRSNEDMVYF
jgi:hypothetical protein